MKKNIAFLMMIISVMILASCGNPSKEKEVSKIKELEKKMAANKMDMMNPEKVRELIKAYKEFADKFPKDTAAATYLFKSAQLSTNIAMGKEAIETYDRIIKDFPTFNKVSDCLFLKAFIYETQLQDMTNAKKYYEEFVKKYPKHELADGARLFLDNPGKTPEEIVKGFEEKAKADSAKGKVVAKK